MSDFDYTPVDDTSDACDASFNVSFDATAEMGYDAPGHPGWTTIEHVDAYTVQPGDSLWAIAEAHYGDGNLWPQIAALNPEVQDNPDLIYPGTVLVMPDFEHHHHGSADVNVGVDVGVDVAVNVDTTAGGDVNVNVDVNTDVNVDVDYWCPTVVDGVIIGDAFAEGTVWFEQSWDGSCQPAAVMEIYNCYSETQVTSVEFVQVVNEYSSGGWVLGPGGTPGMTSEVVVGVLETTGVAATASYGSMTVLEQAITEEYAVMVAYESAGSVSMATVSSVSYEESMVYLSGASVSGVAVGVPIAVFEESWSTAEYSMVECTQTVAEYHEANGIATGSYQSYEYSEVNASASSGTITTATASPWVLLPVSLH
ncbi:MAG: LysM peptidoglycan-binding domain-containing protein [Micrococcales bacterium]|nr:LysM peptidoglycan-binding domain-containing protein [Micrococcales bacterium]